MLTRYEETIITGFLVLACYAFGAMERGWFQQAHFKCNMDGGEWHSLACGL